MLVLSKMSEDNMEQNSNVPRIAYLDTTADQSMPIPPRIFLTTATQLEKEGRAIWIQNPKDIDESVIDDLAVYIYVPATNAGDVKKLDGMGVDEKERERLFKKLQSKPNVVFGLGKRGTLNLFQPATSIAEQASNISVFPPPYRQQLSSKFKKIAGPEISWRELERLANKPFFYRVVPVSSAPIEGDDVLVQGEGLAHPLTTDLSDTMNVSINKPATAYCNGDRCALIIIPFDVFKQVRDRFRANVWTDASVTPPPPGVVRMDLNSRFAKKIRKAQKRSSSSSSKKYPVPLAITVPKEGIRASVVHFDTRPIIFFPKNKESEANQKFLEGQFSGVIRTGVWNNDTKCQPLEPSDGMKYVFFLNSLGSKDDLRQADKFERCFLKGQASGHIPKFADVFILDEDGIESDLIEISEPVPESSPSEASDTSWFDCDFSNVAREFSSSRIGAEFEARGNHARSNLWQHSLWTARELDNMFKDNSPYVRGLEEYRRTMIIAAIMHDIGKLETRGIPHVRAGFEWLANGIGPRPACRDPVDWPLVAVLSGMHYDLGSVISGDMKPKRMFEHAQELSKKVGIDGDDPKTMGAILRMAGALTRADVVGGNPVPDKPGHKISDKALDMESEFSFGGSAWPMLTEAVQAMESELGPTGTKRRR